MVGGESKGSQAESSNHLFIGRRHVGSQFPDQGSNLSPLHWKCGVLTTGWPGMSPILSLFFPIIYKQKTILSSWAI